MLKKTEREETLGTSDAKHQKIEGGAFGEIFSEKSFTMPKKKQKRGPFSLSRYCMLRGKRGKPFWFSSLGQMVQFGTIKLRRTFKNNFGQFVWIVKKCHYKSRVSLHEAPTKKPPWTPWTAIENLKNSWENFHSAGKSILFPQLENSYQSYWTKTKQRSHSPKYSGNRHVGKDFSRASIEEFSPVRLTVLKDAQEPFGCKKNQKCISEHQQIAPTQESNTRRENQTREKVNG